MKKLISICIIIIIVSCNSVKKATKTFNDNRGEAAKYCAETFPTNDSTSFIFGTEYVHDTVHNFTTHVEYQKQHDTIVKTETIVKTITVAKNRVDTLYKTIERSDKIEAKEYELQQLKSSFNYITKEANDWEARAKQNMKWLIILASINVLYLLAKYKFKWL